jgi:DNA (cytosine-5)-methyltransferase 1
MTHIDLFSGIGGFALAARWAGLKTVQFVEIDPFCSRVLAKNFPGVPIHDDIKTFKWTGERPFILTGGFPCQPFSCAGKRGGKEDARYLWPEMLRVVSEAKPTWVIGENVRGLLTIERGMVFEHLLLELEVLGYETEALVIPACAVNAPHRRDRVWIVAHCKRDDDRRTNRTLRGIGEPEEVQQNVVHAPDAEQQRWGEQRRRNEAETVRGGQWNEPWIEVATRLCRVDDGIPRQVDRVNRLKALGNAIVPQVAYEIIRAMLPLSEKNGKKVKA